MLLLATLNQLSRQQEDNYTTVKEVAFDTILTELGKERFELQTEADRVMELLDGLAARGFAYSYRTTDRTEYKSSYLGVARTNRTHVAKDQEIDRLRTEGEGDTLDYKRHYKLSTDAEKREFVKDVTALANAGGAGPRRLLLGVDDNGEFYRPKSADDEQEHRKLLADISEERIQQIVTSRTTHAPSIRIAACGDHREGPYVLVEITRDVGHLPYRIYRNQEERTAANADELGEVWVRKGSTKGRATETEIAALARQSALHQHIRGFR